VPKLINIKPIDYLIIGHLACDLTPAGPRLGGTAAYSGLTARALGLEVGVVTAWGGEFPLDALDGIQVLTVPAEKSTTFENVYTHSGRVQYLHARAPELDFQMVPPEWRHAAIIHLGPIAQEIQPVANGTLSPSLLGLTPQGWLRCWDGNGRVKPCAWPGAQEALTNAGAVIISVDDVDKDEDQIEAMALACRVLVVTEGPAGARLYWNGDLRRFRAPELEEIDATGAGDIFAAAFFTRLHVTRDPWEAARFATCVASLSVARRGLEGVPIVEEIQACLVEVF